MNIFETVTECMLTSNADYPSADECYEITNSTFEQRRQARIGWLSATTFEQMCELMALFIEGKSPFIPGYCKDHVAPETESLVEPLARLNRGGFLTTCSQPGMSRIYDALWKGSIGVVQRAFVDGFTSKEIASKLAQANSRFDLRVRVFEPTPIALPITNDLLSQELAIVMKKQIGVTRALEGQVYTWSGGNVSLFSYRDFSYFCNPEVMNALMSAHFVSVVDRKWRRRDLLWDTVLGCINS